MLSSRWYWRNTVVQHGVKLFSTRVGLAGHSRYISHTAETQSIQRHANFKTPCLGVQQLRRLSTTPTPWAAYDPSKYRTKKTNKQDDDTSIPNGTNWTERIQPYLTLAFLKTLFKFVATTYLSFHFVTIFYTIKGTYGPSMLPTISWDKEAVLISNFFHRRGRNISVGDVISFEHPVRPGYRSIKRVIGMPGDFVCRDTPGKGQGWLVQVPEGCCWVMGDNLGPSRDSRMFGPVSLALVRGKVIAAWSWARWPRMMKNTLEDAEGLETGAKVHGEDKGETRGRP